jgi:predicted PurR-regulated permease PerM
MDRRPGKNIVRGAAVALLAIGCIYVLLPFLAAILFAAAVVISSWPLYLRLRRALGGRRTLAALTMTLSLTLLVIIPLALVAWSLAENAAGAFDAVRASLGQGDFAPPAWVRDIPLVGDHVDAYLRQLLGSRERMMELGQRLVEPARHYLVAGGLMLGNGVVQMALAAFVSFFFYRDGESLKTVTTAAMQRVMGEEAQPVARIVDNTVRGVMYGLLGTALAQGVVAAIGFAIAGVPAVLLLAVLVFVSSMIPVGPPVVWGGAAIWLFAQGSTGWGIFMLVWGFFVISGVDNVVRPMLISRGSSLPFLLTLLGVLGGVIAFGFVGLFIGPTLLAVGYSLMSGWTHTQDPIVKQDGNGL